MNTVFDKKDDDRIKCDVCNCMYNDKGCSCTAKQIAVGPDFATSQSDTICGTFKKA